jgi:hypothetical protein
MTDISLLLYALCGVCTFWVVYSSAASAADVEPPTPNAAAAVSLAAGVVWPLVLLGAIQVCALAAIGSLAAARAA